MSSTRRLLRTRRRVSTDRSAKAAQSCQSFKPNGKTLTLVSVTPPLAQVVSVVAKRRHEGVGCGGRLS